MPRPGHRLHLLSYGFLTFIVFGFVLYMHLPNRMSLSLPPPEYLYEHSAEEPLDPDQTCQFPSPDPFDESVLEYVANGQPIQCKSRHEHLTYIDRSGHLCLNQTALLASGYRQGSSLSCKYQGILRPLLEDDRVEYGPVEDLLEERSPPLLHDFVSVWCTNFAGFTVYSAMHAHVVVRNESVIRRADVHGPARQHTRRRKLNVLLFVIDSMSRLNFIRQLPKTYFYLVRELQAIVLRGMTKVGDNSYPNMVPLLTGRRAYHHAELDRLPNGSLSADVPLDAIPSYFDAWPIIWRNFSSLGYATLFAEDQPEFNIFNYLSVGFLRQPTHHYLRPFWIAAEASLLHRISSNLCLGAVPKHRLQTDYVLDFMRKYCQLHVPYFGLTHLNEISHDYLNQVGVADDDFLRFLQQASEDGLLNDTLLVVMADHGHRFDPILNTQIGRIENRMPFTAIRLPEWVLAQFPEAATHLRTNARRLTTALDLHHTLVDVLKYSGGETDALGTQVHGPYGGTTLFGSIATQRTCLHASIPSQFCSCDEEVAVATDNSTVREAAFLIVLEINRKTASHRPNLCATLTIKRIQSAVAMVARSAGGVEKKRQVQEAASHQDGLPKEDLRLRITVEVSPSDGLFEGVVMVSGAPSKHGVGNMTVLDGINRINRYSGQGDCLSKEARLTDPQIGMFCYCTTFRSDRKR